MTNDFDTLSGYLTEIIQIFDRDNNWTSYARRQPSDARPTWTTWGGFPWPKARRFRKRLNAVNSGGNVDHFGLILHPLLLSSHKGFSENTILRVLPAVPATFFGIGLFRWEIIRSARKFISVRAVESLTAHLYGSGLIPLEETFYEGF